MRLHFPEGFLWGSATAAHQIEGENIHSDWWEWETSPKRRKQLLAEGKNPEEYICGIACDSYRRFEEDFSLAQELGQNAHRLSIEWARIEPEEGIFNKAEIQHYQRVLQTAKAYGLTTFVTLHHYTNPLWFAIQGAFEKQNNRQFFLRYALHAIEQLDAFVDFWITFNEPEVYIKNAYLLGTRPPQRRNIFTAVNVAHNIIVLHNTLSEKMKTLTTKPVGIAHKLSAYRAVGFGSKRITRVVDYIANRYILSRTVAKSDFIGVNYYSSYGVNLWRLCDYNQNNRGKTDMGWGIYPEGLESLLLDLKAYQKTVYITENGLADKADTKRWQFIREHLYYLHRAIQKGVDVRGYLHWSLIDNFEWDKGFSPRFGLVAIDRAHDLKREIRKSALQYARVCKSNMLEAESFA